MHIFLKTDTYKISYGKNIFKTDNKVLVRLYQPIIGAIAASLYLTLDSEISLNKQARVYVTVDRLLKLSHITLKEFNLAIEQLVSVGLLTLRANARKENDYLFKLSSLKSATEFFENEKLTSSLKDSISDVYYEQIVKYFTDAFINEDEYVDLVDIKKELSEDEFYVQLFDKYQMLKVAIDESIKLEVARIKRLFDIQYDKIELALLNSVAMDSDNKWYIDSKQLNKYIEENFLTVKIDDNKVDNNQVLENDSNYYAAQLEKIKPIKYYEKNIGRTLLPSEINQLSALQSKYQIADGMFNAIIDYYFQYGKKLVGSPFAYFAKVIDTTKAYGCKNAFDTMEYFRGVSKSINSTKKEYVNKNIAKKEESKKNIKTIEKIIKPDDDDKVDDELYKEFLKAIGG